MYNRYLNDSNAYVEPLGEIPFEEVADAAEAFKEDKKKEAPKDLFQNLSSMFSDKLKAPSLTLENIVLLVIIYFLIADSIDMDLIVILAILVFLGM